MSGHVGPEYADITVNGEEACEAYETHEFDIILMDCKMPRVDGFEATRRIRQLPQPEKRDIPILGVTANVLESDVKRCFDAGMNGVLHKPFSRIELSERIIQALSAVKEAQANTPSAI